MPWRPLPRIAFAVAIYPFQPSQTADLPLELGDELYIIEEGGPKSSWYRGYLVAPPSLLAGLTCVKGQTLEARVFSGIFPRNCVEIREVLGDGGTNGTGQGDVQFNEHNEKGSGENDPQCTISRDGSTTERKPIESAKWPEPTTNGASRTESIRSAAKRTEWSAKSRDSTRKTSRGSLIPSKSQALAFPITPISMSPREPGGSRPPAPVPMLKIGDETPTSLSEPLVDEIASCLREWHSTNLHELLLSRQYSTLDKLSKLVHQLDLARRQLLHGVLTDQELEILRATTVWNLVSGNKMLSNEVIVRDPEQRGRLLTGDDTAIEISKLQSSMSLLEKPPISVPDSIYLHHMLLDFKGVVQTSRDSTSTSLAISLFAKKSGEPPVPLTEPFTIDLPPQDQISKAVSAGKFRTLFSDLTSSDIGEASGSDTKLFLVIKVTANRLTQPASLLPSRTATLRESASTAKDAIGSNGSQRTDSVRSGRRSLMWGQNRTAKSLRDRSHQTSTMSPSKAGAGSNPSIEEEEEQENGTLSRPNTGAPSQFSTQQGPQFVKKSVGVAVTDLKHFLAHDGVMEQTLTVWSPSETSMEIQEPEQGWDEIVQEILSSKSRRYEKSKHVNQIRLRLHSFVSPNADFLIRKTPTLLHNVFRTSKVGFSGAPTKPRSDIYITLLSPHLPAQALFSHPERGIVQLPTTLDMHNIQLTLEVRNASGERIEHCIFPSSNSSGHTAWRTTAVERGEAWNQTIKLVIPRDDVPNSHLIMSIADAPGFPFALSWIPLWEKQAFIKDGKHSPLLYLYDKITSNTESGRGAYLDFPWDSNPREGTPRIESLTGPVAVLYLESYLCSTEFSQDQVLLGVLKWREQPEDQLLVMLRQLVFVPEIEIVKVVSDVFDALFGILVDRSGNDEYEDLVFNDLVTVLGIVHDRRFNLGPLVNEYADTRFNYPFATPCLIRSYLRLLATPTDYQNSRNLRATFKVGRQVLKFITTARKLQIMKEASIGITNTQLNFHRDFKRIFSALESLMLEPSPALIGSKTLVVQHMHSWLPELTDCFSKNEIAHMAVSFVNACADVKGKLILHKLVLILNLIKATELDLAHLKSELDEKIASWIAPYWGTTDKVTEQYREQVHLCSSIVAAQMPDSGSGYPSFLPKIIESYKCLQIANNPQRDYFTLLFPSTYPFQAKPISTRTSFNENLIELSALLAGFSSATLVRVTSLYPNESELQQILSATLEVEISILSGEAFPASWLTLHVYHHRSVLLMLEGIAVVLEQRYLPSPDDADDFRTELWKTFLSTLLKLMRSEAIALETFPEQKRRAVWKIAGDVREQGAALLEKSWDAIGWDANHEDQQQYGLHRLGGYQVQYVPSLVAPIVELCMSVHAGLRAVAVKILQSMIVSEWTLNEDLAVIQAEVVECLDQLFKSRDIGEVAQQKLFVNELLDLFEPVARSPGNPLWEAIKQLVSTTDELLDLLVAVHSAGTTEAFRIMNTLRLMDFLKGMQKEDIYIRYVHQLADIQAHSRNATEAGLALRLHADLYSWDITQNVEALTSPAYPKQSSFDRKESLYFEMIKFFEEGSAWDSALTSYRELAEQYEFALFDFAKLARTQRSTAKIYEIIARGEGIAPRYFRVAYRGLGFPSSLRDKQFIFEGHGSERLSAFTDRLQRQFPAAQLVPQGEVDNVEGQFLQVSAVNPHRDLEHPLYQRSKVPQSTRDFILSSQPNRFTITSKRHSPKHNVKDQWIEKTLYTTVDTFPTILRRSEVVSVQVLPLSPLQTAVERTTRKTSELAILEKRITEGDASNFFNMTDAIKSSVNPNSTTSVAQYRELLPQPEQHVDEYGEEIPQDDRSLPLETALKIALLDFASTLRRCLMLYSRPEQQATQVDFASQFASTFAPELAVLAPPATVMTAFAINSGSPDPAQSSTEHLMNGTSHYDEPEFRDTRHSSTIADPTLPPMRNRFSSFLKRMNTSDTNSQANTNAVVSTNGYHAEASANGHQHSYSGARSTSSSRVSSPSRVPEIRNSRVGTATTENRKQIDTLRGHGQGRTESDTRPVTAHSAARPVTAHSIATITTNNTAKESSLRKRLSSLGIGKKVSKPNVMATATDVLQEE